jgi:drug/metabolite transporter (DMT)-like permease
MTTATAPLPLIAQPRIILPNLRHLAKGAGLLMACGALWGAMPALSRLAGNAEAGLSGALGLSLWVNILGACLALVVSAVRGKLLLPNFSQMKFYAAWAVLYSLLNQVLIYWVCQSLSCSLVSVITVLEGFIIFGVAALWRIDTLNWVRFCGLGLGAAGVVLLMAAEIVRQSALPLGSLAIAFVIPATYAAESLFIASHRPTNADPIASVGLVMLASVPMLLIANWACAGTQAFTMPNLSFVLAALPIMFATLIANVCYFALIKTCGAVFAGQCSNFVTLFGVLWGALLVGETTSSNFAIALMLILSGLTVVGIKPNQERIA